MSGWVLKAGSVGGFICSGCGVTDDEVINYEIQKDGAYIVYIYLHTYCKDEMLDDLCKDRGQSVQSQPNVVTLDKLIEVVKIIKGVNNA